jgi:glycerol-3-phosphate dehydrogenase
VTTHLKLVGAENLAGAQPPISGPQGLHSYGDEAAKVQAMPGAKRDLGGGLTEAMVRFAARHEYARTAEDMLARRWRLLFLDARQAGAIARKVGDILAQETGVDPQVEAFQDMTRLYLTLPL